MARPWSFRRAESGRFDLFRRAARGGAEEARLFTATDPSYADDWSPDGRYIVYSSEAPGRSWNLGLLDVAASQATPLAASQYNEYQGRISPDGRWLAFTSDETGRPEVYVRAFPVGDANVVISTGGGSEPAWRRDSSELFYLSPEGTMMSVSMTASGGRLAAGRPQSLFRIRIPGRSLRNGSTVRTECGWTTIPGCARRAGERSGRDHSDRELASRPSALTVDSLLLLS